MVDIGEKAEYWRQVWGGIGRVGELEREKRTKGLIESATKGIMKRLVQPPEEPNALITDAHRLPCDPPLRHPLRVHHP